MSGEKQDWNVLRLIASAHKLRSFEAVHPRHQHVQENHREIVLQDQLERLTAGLSADQVVVRLRQNALERQDILRRVVDEQDVDLVQAGCLLHYVVLSF